ncbi:MAG: discoidin domain-containing protein [Melioribacteraceae bacterium]|nr:discoidin domain-containing protein [Melioribacteraceae bacterium]
MNHQIQNIKNHILFLTLFIVTSVFGQSANYTSEKLDIRGVSASSTTNTLTSPLSTFDGKGAFDGDVNSRWSTYPTPAWITYDLGSEKHINKTRISFYYFNKGRIYTYSVKVSKDNKNWTTVVDRAESGSTEFTENEFTSTNGRYVKYEMHSANNTKWATIWETEIFGNNDIIAPELSSIEVLTENSLQLNFSEEIRQNDAEVIYNYYIGNGIIVENIAIINATALILETSNHLPGNYNITVSNIHDNAGNLIDENNSTEYTIEKKEAVKLNVVNVAASSTTNTLTSPMSTIDGKGAFDGDATSRWSTYPTPAWITYDLGSIQQISKTRFSFYYFDKGRIYTYSISVSEDNINWTTVVNRAESNSTEFTENEFASTNGRFVKIDLHSANNSKWATIWEAEFYGYQTVSTKSIEFVVNQGWNIVSLPVADSIAIDSLFENTNLSNAFNYDEYYVQHDTIKSGLGYWVRFEKDTNFVVNGNVTNDIIELKEGWNMIGSFDSILVDQLYTEPENILTSPFYGFEGNYTIADTLFNGKGYWVKASEAGTLHIGEVSLGKSLSKSALDNSEMISVTITDNKNNSMTLYLSDNSTALNKISLPPVPPKGVFDVRFTNGSLVSSLSDVQSSIKITDAEYPVTITSNSNNIILKDNIDGTYLNENISKNSSVIISDEFVDLISIEMTALPMEYQLDQNYPNPFNPTTTIAFSIPSKSKVQLAIYNILGEKVTDLLNKQLDAGNHKVNFNATNLSSGIYLYVLESENFSSVKKMTLLK